MSSVPPLNLGLKSLFDLSGKVALVTGGGSGIGYMIAQGLAQNGARVYLAGRREALLQSVADQFQSQSQATSDTSVSQGQGQIIPLTMDVTDKKSILEGVKVLEEKEGKLHILVNNAGQTGPCSLFFNDLSAPQHKDAGTLGRALFDNESFESWSSLYSVNTFSIFFVTTAFLGLLSKASEGTDGYTASVVNVTSISGILKVAQDHFAYNSAKAAATHLTKMLATELALKKIPVRVNSVAPGVYESEMTIDTIPPELVNKVAKAPMPVPAGRAGTAEEVAGAVIFLVSKAGCYTNGHELVVDGGAVAVNPSTV